MYFIIYIYIFIILFKIKYIRLIFICVFYSLFFFLNPDNHSHVKQVWILQPLCCRHLLVHGSTASKSMDPLNGQKYMDALMLQPHKIVEYLHPWENCLYIKAMKDSKEMWRGWEIFPRLTLKITQFNEILSLEMLYKLCETFFTTNS